MKASMWTGMVSAALTLAVLVWFAPIVAAQDTVNSDSKTGKDLKDFTRQDMFDKFARPGSATGRVMFHSDEDVEDQASDMQITEYDFSLNIPLMRRAHDHLDFTFTYNHLDLDTNASLLNNDPKRFGNSILGAKFPDSLQSMVFDLGYQRMLENDWIIDAHVSIGSASDELFHSNDEITFAFSSLLMIPHKDFRHWVVYVGFDSKLNFPVVGVGYQFPLNRESFAVIGLPFAVIHYESDKWNFDGSYIPIQNASARLGYEIIDDKVELFGAFDWKERRYFRADREDDDLYLAYSDAQATAGIRYLFHDNASAEVYGGFAFHRFFYEGDSYGDIDDSISLGDSAIVGVQLTIDW